MADAKRKLLLKKMRQAQANENKLGAERLSVKDVVHLKAPFKLKRKMINTWLTG